MITAAEARQRCRPKLLITLQAIAARVDRSVAENADFGYLSMRCPVEPFAVNYVAQRLRDQGHEVTIKGDELHIVWLPFDQVLTLVQEPA